MKSIFKRRSGSIAIEALASLLLLFIAVYSMWGLSVFIYNQSRISTATQLAAQAGIIVANRDASREAEINQSVRGVFAANVCGMIPGQREGGSRPGEDTCSDNSFSNQPGVPTIQRASLNTSIECSQDLSEDNFNKDNCIGSDYSKKRAIKLDVEGAVIAPFSLIDSLGGGTTENSPTISDSASVYSYSVK